MEELHITVLFFAKARELVGQSEAVVACPKVASKETLFEAVERAFPRLKALRRGFILSLNQEYVEGDGQYELGPGDELAVIPPISGG